MKKFLCFLIPFILLFANSCKQVSNKSATNCCLSTEDSLSIVKQIIDATDAYADANNKIDINKAADFWDKSPDFVFAETGKEYANWDSLYFDIKNWYSQPLDLVELKWEERKIYPLNLNTATLYSKFYFKAKFKSGIVYTSRATFSGIMTKKIDIWRMTIGYCSIKILENN